MRGLSSVSKSGPVDVFPSVLYKYRDDSVRTEDIFKQRKVWLPNPESLNDPLECKTGKIPEEIKERIAREMEVAQITGAIGFPFPAKTLFSLSERKTMLWLRRFRPLSHEEKVLAVRALYKKHGIDLSEPRKIFSLLSEQLAGVGVFSLSSIADNQPMWAHYAGNHTGLAIGFSTTNGADLGNPMRTLKVKYHDEKPKFDGHLLNTLTIHQEFGHQVSDVRFALDDPLVQASLSTKPSAWSYEKEWRYVREKSGLIDAPGEIVSVIFGYRMKKERRRQYVELFDRAPNLSLFEVVVTDDGHLMLDHYR